LARNRKQQSLKEKDPKKLRDCAVKMGKRNCILKNEDNI
jgi:hypothetical protein